jgi:hypothetical protein
MRWDVIPVRPQHGILHAKVALLSWSRHARLIVGSANLTDDGYRRNHEVFGVLDYMVGGDSPLPVLDDMIAFLRDAASASSPESGISPAVARCRAFLDRVSAATRRWGASEPPRAWTKLRVFAVLIGPGRPDAFATIREQWPDSSPPHSAYVMSPFFDAPDAPNEPARKIWDVLKQRGAAYVEYDVDWLEQLYVGRAGVRQSSKRRSEPGLSRRLAAWWPVNVVDGDALPPPDALKDLPLEVLIDILTSAKPLHEVLKRWTKQQAKGGLSNEGLSLDPHKRIDTSAFLLQRTRRVSWALAALRQRLEQPVVSEQSLAWRLRGPVGVLAFAQAIGKDASSEPRAAERCFLLTELCAELARARPQEAPGSLPAAHVRASLRELIHEIRAGISTEALAGEPAWAAYAKTVFEEVVP